MSFIGTHRVASGLHIAQLFSKNAAGLPLTPVCCSVERSPAIEVHGWHIQPTLTQYPGQHNSRTMCDWISTSWQIYSVSILFIFLIHDMLTWGLLCSLWQQLHAVGWLRSWGVVHQQAGPHSARSGHLSWSVPPPAAWLPPSPHLNTQGHFKYFSNRREEDREEDQ